MRLSEVLAHAGEELVELPAESVPLLQEVVRSNSIRYALIASGMLLLLIILSAFIKHKKEIFKVVLFIAIVVIVLFNTTYLVGSTIYINRLSVTGGPIHWHADFEIWNCGEEVKLENPKGLSNYIGNPIIHEHGDKRIHIEGALLDLHHASLGHFFASIGGNMSNKHLTVPTNNGLLVLRNGDLCFNDKPARLLVFVYRVENGIFWQEKLTDPQNFIIASSSSVPPGDCVIFEFAPEDKPFTDKMCISFIAAKELGKIHER